LFLSVAAEIGLDMDGSSDALIRKQYLLSSVEGILDKGKILRFWMFFLVLIVKQLKPEAVFLLSSSETAYW
jgi:hypothetical protein